MLKGRQLRNPPLGILSVLPAYATPSVYLNQALEAGVAPEPSEVWIDSKPPGA
jgi:hypothetical protein